MADLEALGALVDVRIRSGRRWRRGIAMLDTGAARTCVSEQTLEAIGAKLVGYCKATTVAGCGVMPMYSVRVSDGHGVHELDVIGIGAEGPLTCILGRDFLSHRLMKYDGAAGTFALWTGE